LDHIGAWWGMVLEDRSIWRVSVGKIEQHLFKHVSIGNFLSQSPRPDASR
jgi:hypothetical protein